MRAIDHTRAARRANGVVVRYPRAGRGWSRVHARLYRLTGGHFMPSWFGAPVMVLETIGRRTSKPRAVPVLYLEDGDALVVLAANAGADRTPAWWLNLRQARQATAVIGGGRRRVRPRVLTGAERERLWKEFTRMYPQAQEYTRFTDRELPLIALLPLERNGAGEP